MGLPWISVPQVRPRTVPDCRWIRRLLEFWHSIPRRTQGPPPSMTFVDFTGSAVLRDRTATTSRRRLITIFHRTSYFPFGTLTIGLPIPIRFKIGRAHV